MSTSRPHIVQVNISPGGVPKRPVPEGYVTFSRVKGDDWNDKRHHGFRDQALCLFSIELIEELNAEGFPLFPGALGENLTTEGIDYRKVRLGDVWLVGGQVSLRITKVRTPCRTITVYGNGIIRDLYDLDVKRGNVYTQKWGRSGYYAEVIHEGIVRPGDNITIQSVNLTTTQARNKL
jgi:MOSC domain-containing protein YiiM